MPLFSITYTTNQYSTQVYHSEIGAPCKPGNLIILSHLRYAGRRFFVFDKQDAHLGGGPGRRHFRQMQRDELHVLRSVKFAVRIEPLHQNADPSERYACDDRETSQHCAENDDV